MAAIDDLNAAIANIGTAVDAAANDIATLKANQATAVPADQVQAAATAAQGLADKLTAALG